jgi:hypothetical protein
LIARRIGVVALVLLSLIPAAHLVAETPRLGGIDNYYFLLYANDLVASPTETSFARYAYFPGSYAFWRVVAKPAGRNLLAYQSVFVGVGIMNALLVAGIVGAAGGGLLLSAAAFCGYLAFGERLELAQMTTEPLVTLAALIGVLSWTLLERKGRATAALAALGAGYGVAVFMKQQGAFVALGAAGLIPFLRRPDRTMSRAAADGALLVAVALSVFIVGMAFDGGGVPAVKMGIGTAFDYQSRGRLLANLVRIGKQTPALFAAFAAAGALLPFALAAGRRRVGERFSSIPAWSLAVATAAITLLQFEKRSYEHYALLTLPFALVAIALALRWALDALPGKRAIFLGEAVALAFSIGLATLSKEPTVRDVPRDETLKGDCSGILAGQKLLLLPSRDNALHWACGTHARDTRWGYTFNWQERPDEYIAELEKPDLNQVFVFNATRAGSYERDVASRHDWSPFFAALDRLGYRPVSRTDLGTLFRRDSTLSWRRDHDAGSGDD